MSIIHDALKKVQQELAAKSNNSQAAAPPPAANPQTPANPFAAVEQPKNTSLFETPPSSTPAAGPLRKTYAADENKAKSILALFCAAAITLGAFWFFFKQLNTYAPQAQRWARSGFYKIIRKQEPPAFKTKAPQDLVPLAKITVTPPPAAPVKPQTPAAAAAAVTAAAVTTPAAAKAAVSNPMATIQAPAASAVTLNVHGVMANGSRNIVLINDQVYQEGDEVDGVKILKINLNYITVNIDGKEQQIRVKN